MSAATDFRDDQRLDSLENLSKRQARDQLAEWLNSAIDQWPNWLDHLLPVDSPHESTFIARDYGRNLARAYIDELYGEQNLLPGARLDLADGLWRPIDIAECIPEDWSGMCDFVCCTSEYLVEEVKCCRPASVFRADARLLRPSRAFAVIEKIIPRLKVEHHPGDDFVATYLRVASDCDLETGRP